MKRIVKYIPVAVLATLLGTACSPQEIYTYKDTKDNVYFDYYKNPQKVDFNNYTFFDTPGETEMEVEIPVRIAGERRDYDRHFNVFAKSPETDLPLNTVYAVSPDDYELETTGVVPAGEGVGYVKLKLKNHADMADQWFMVKLDLAVSDDFDIKFSGGLNQLNTATVTFSRMLVMPDWWNKDVDNNWCSELQTWNRTVHELFRAVTGMKELPPLNDRTNENSSNAMTAVNTFLNFMEDPISWETRDGYTITPMEPVNGFETFSFEVDATGRKYFFQNNTDMGGLIVWQNLDTEAWDILYNN